MSAQRYWYLANDPRRPVTALSAEEEEERVRNDWVRDLPEDIQQRVIESRVLTEPDWPEIHSYNVPEEVAHPEEGRVPMLFTTKEGAVSELRGIKEASEPPLYVRAVEGGGEEVGDEVVNSGMPPYKVFGLDADLLLSKLKDAGFEYVVVDGRVQLRRDLIKELELELS
jgi:hypothetical protein